MGEFKITFSEIAHPTSRISNFLEEFIIMVPIIGLKKFIKIERRTDMLDNPIKINTEFFRVLRKFLEASKPKINNIDGSSTAGPKSIIYLIIL